MTLKDQMLYAHHSEPQKIKHINIIAN